MKNIFNFCDGAERISGCTEKIENLSKYLIKLDINKDEIYRSRYDKDMTAVFNFILNIKNEQSLKEELVFMKTIELFYPNKFSWRFNGKHIEAIGKIPTETENLGIISRYGGIAEFIKYLRKRLLTILKYRGIHDVPSTIEIEEFILATGSLNSNTDLFCIPINTDMTYIDILNNSTKRNISGIGMKALDMKFWVREINPDFFKPYTEKTIKKYPISDKIFEKYPPCVHVIANKKLKGNYGRFLLSTFLLGVHNERDAKHQLDIMLSDEEKVHMNHGNCKDQWRTIVAREYSAPSCKTMIENGFCTENCGKPYPIILD